VNIKDYIESGILEMHVLGISSEEESLEVKRMIVSHPEIKKEVDEITSVLELYGNQNKNIPPAVIKPFLMATIDYSERIRKGELAGFPPLLSDTSKIEDYNEWLHRADMTVPNDLDDIYAKLIGYTPAATTAIVWIKSMAPNEVHDNEFEKFLIVEGTCDIIIGEAVHQLIPGDYLSIPLHIGHQVKVTSLIPCKIILQRIAA